MMRLPVGNHELGRDGAGRAGARLLRCLRTGLVLLLLPVILSGCGYEQLSPALHTGGIPGKKRMRELKAMGIRTIVNLRTNSMPGTGKYARSIGLNYFHIPTGVVLVPKEKEIREFLAIVCNPDYQPVYVYCTLYTDRTLYYETIYRIAVDNWTVDQAIEHMHSNGLKMWWPTFREYDDEIRNHAELIRSLGAQCRIREELMTEMRSRQTAGSGAEKDKETEPETERARPSPSQDSDQR